MIYNDLSIIFPEIFISVFAMVALVGAVYTSKDETAQKVTWFTAIVFIFLAFLMIFSEVKTEIAFGVFFLILHFRHFTKILN